MTCILLRKASMLINVSYSLHGVSRKQSTRIEIVVQLQFSFAICIYLHCEIQITQVSKEVPFTKQVMKYPPLLIRFYSCFPRNTEISWSIL